jgi:hypothetical protein
MPYDANVGDLVIMTVTVTDVERETKGNFVSHCTMKGAPETEDRSTPPGPKPPGPGPDPNGKILRPQLVAPDIREVRKEKWDEFGFDEYSAVNITHAEEENGFVFFVNMDNRFLIHELHKAKQGEESLVKHWFKYGVVLSALGIIKELERVEECRTDGEEKEGEPEEADNLQKVSRFCADLARVVVPMIRALSAPYIRAPQPSLNQQRQHELSKRGDETGLRNSGPCGALRHGRTHPALIEIRARPRL